MKKKWAALLFAALFSLSATVLAACSEPENSGDEGKDPGGEEPPVAELVYPDDPEFESLSSSENGVSGSHDPSLIEVDGTFYSFSTGWLNGGNEIRRSTDLIHWDYVGVTFNNFQGNAPSGESWDTEYSDVLEALHAPSMDTISFWAPDIVEAADGGYWLYTCGVYGRDQQTSPDGWDRACIFLCHSDDLTPGSFSYVGMIFQSVLASSGSRVGEINAIDPQIIYDTEGKMYMAYGSFTDGLYILEMDPHTGLRAAGFNEVYTDSEVHAFTAGRFTEGSDGDKYCGTLLTELYAAMEAPVIARHDGVKIYNDDGTVKETVDSRYFFMSSYGLLASSYNMRYGISDTVTGPYLDYAGEELYSRYGYDGTGYKAMGAYQFVYADGSAMSMPDGRYEAEYNVYAPGHNDLFTAQNGVSVAARINRYYQAEVSGFSLFVNQYYLNSQGQIVINPNRYAGERLRTVSAEEVAQITGGSYQGVLMQETEDATSAPRISSAATFTKTGENGGTFTFGDMRGTWTVFGKNFIRLDAYDTHDIYYGVISPAWLEGPGSAGLTVAAIGQETGMALWFNSDPTAA